MKKSNHILIILTTILIIGCGTGGKEIKKSSIPYIDTGINSDSWVLIPAGEFLKGMHNHEIMIDYDFEIMITDVTNEQYAEYLNEALKKETIKLVDDKVMGYYAGEDFDSYNHEVKINEGDKLHLPLNEVGVNIIFDGNKFSVIEGYENHPVVMVTWFGAKAFCNFNGFRLPTENEWEKAARGNDDRAYPWGNEIALNQANFYSSHDLIQKLFGDEARTTPVGYYNGKNYDGYHTKDGQSPFGLYDMAGNVWQWTADDFPDTHLRYMRGGSQANYEYNLRVWARNSAGPDYYGINIGFRCVRDVETAEVIEEDIEESN